MRWYTHLQGTTNLNIDFQIGFGFELNDYDDIIIGLVDDEQREAHSEATSFIFCYLILFRLLIISINILNSRKNI